MSYKQAIIKRHYDDGTVGYAYDISGDSERFWVRTSPRAVKLATRMPVKLALQILGERKKRFPDSRYSMEVV